MLGQAAARAIECTAAALAAGARHGVRVEVLPQTDTAVLCDGTLDACDSVVVVGAAGFVSGAVSEAVLRRRVGRRPEIVVISWQHDEQTVVGLLECGVDQYMTLPLSLRRLCVKLLGQRKF